MNSDISSQVFHHPIKLVIAHFSEIEGHGTLFVRD